MAQIIELPHVGESVTEGVIGKWLKQVGEPFEKYEPLVEVVTDKVNMEVPAPFDGVLTKIVAQEGETVPMGATIAEAEATGAEAVAERSPSPTAPQRPTEVAPARPDEDERRARIGTFIEGRWGGPTGGLPEDEQPAAPPVTATPAPAPEAPPREGMRLRYSPVVSRLAQEHKVDLAQISGTGLGGRITKRDVLTYIEQREEGAVAGPPPAPPEAPGRDEEAVPLTPVRRTIAAHMARSVREIPHAWTVVEVDVTNLVRRRESVKDEFREREGVPLTYLPFVTKVVVEALRENPDVNARWGGDAIIHRKRINIGIAVAAQQGLVVPVIHDADSLSIAGLAWACHDLIQGAHAGKLQLQDVQGGTFTVNNTGALGSVLSGPLINYPQAAIITTEAIVKRLVVRPDDSIAIGHMMNMCLSFDHRILDGLGAGTFLNRVKEGLEAIGPETPIY